MRLIDADLLMRKCEKWLKPKAPDEEEMVSWADIAVSMLMEIEEQPTAFDVEKAIGQIEAIKEKGACFDEQCKQCKYLSHCWDGEESGSLAFDKAIEIVKRGGRDEK